MHVHNINIQTYLNLHCILSNKLKINTHVQVLHKRPIKSCLKDCRSNNYTKLTRFILKLHGGLGIGREGEGNTLVGGDAYQKSPCSVKFFHHNPYFLKQYMVVFCKTPCIGQLPTLEPDGSLQVWSVSVPGLVSTQLRGVPSLRAWVLLRDTTSSVLTTLDHNTWRTRMTNWFIPGLHVAIFQN